MTRRMRAVRKTAKSEEGERDRESYSLLGQEGDRGSSWNDGLQVLPPTCEMQ